MMAVNFACKLANLPVQSSWVWESCVSAQMQKGKN